MTTLEFLEECEEMALHNMSCYHNKEQYKKEYNQEAEKLAIIRDLMHQVSMNLIRNSDLKLEEE